MGGAEPRNTRGLRERFVEFSGLEAKEVVTVVFELDMAECTVGVEDVIPAIQLDCCGILLHSFLEMALLEEFVCLRLDLLGLGYLFRRWLRHTGGRLTLVNTDLNEVLLLVLSYHECYSWYYHMMSDTPGIIILLLLIILLPSGSRGV